MTNKTLYTASLVLPLSYRIEIVSYCEDRIEELIKK
jgi:hypothetical protein